MHLPPQPFPAKSNNFVREVFTWHALIPVLIVAFVIYLVLPERVISQPPGILAPHEPLQEPPSIATSYPFKDYTITPLADYKITARVLAKLVYRFGRDSDLAPVDLLLGWQKMSDTSTLNHFKFYLLGRYYTLRTDLTTPAEEINKQLSNHHLIPATSDIESSLRNIRVGQVVHMEGFLVRINGKNGFSWSSSLTRTDSGWGACELFYVRKIKEIDTPS